MPSVSKYGNGIGSFALFKGSCLISTRGDWLTMFTWYI